MYKGKGADGTVTIIFTIIISALVVRAIYSILEYIRLLSDECVDGKPDNYEEMICGLLKTLFIVLLCAFLIILIYEGLKRYFSGK
jgi:hypothetical protein